MKTFLAVLLVAGALLLGAAPSGATAPAHNPPMGLVPHRGSHAHVAKDASTGGQLYFHGGNVMHTNTVYAIYWMPGGSAANSCDAAAGYTCAEYENAVNTYFTDVAAASGSGTNAYAVATQYYDGSGSVAYNSTFGGSYVDTTAFPASQCSDLYQGAQDSTCLTDQQLTAEIANVIATKSWPEDTASPSHLYFIFTPSNVGVCDVAGSPATGAQCSTNVFCAYHDHFLAGGGANIAYAVEPDNATIPTAGCNAGPTPVGFGADATINTISHEHNEAITDPWPNGGWLDSSGNENGDKCAWSYMSYETINGDQYYLQEEYSNANSACEASYTPSSLPPTPVNSVPPVVTGVAAVGQTVTSSAGTWAGSPTAYQYQWQQCSSAGTSCANIPGATAASYSLAPADAGHEIRSEVSAENGGGWSSAVPSVATEAVVPEPSVTASPVVSGVTAVGKTLSTTQGTWNTPVSFAYEWLRCSSGGTSCSSISGADTSSYTLTRADAGHVLEARVSATNAAATTTATSAPTAVVVDVPKAAGKLPHISGKAKVGKKLSITAGTWGNAPTTFRFQWLRCSKHGTHCVHIPRATKAAYRLTKKDAKHRLRVKITAVNDAGTASSTSSASRVVKK